MMRTSTKGTSLGLALGLCLSVAAGTAGQSETPPPGGEDDGPAAIAPLPELEGLAWHRAIDLTGPEIESTLPEDEVEAWGAMLDDAGATFDRLEYTFDAAFDPSDLPRLGAVATVRVAGADEETLREAVVQDVISQVVGLGEEPPEPRQTTIAEKDVTVLSLPSVMGYEEATVYASGDVAYVLLLPLDLVVPALEQLP